MVDIPEDEYEERVARAQLAREEARETISEQTSTLSDIDEKAIQVFRINIVVASILVTGLSIAVSSKNLSSKTLITPYTTTGGLLLFTSIVLSATTYTSTAEKIGITRESIAEGILNQQYDYDLVEEEIALKYGQMIHYNFRKNASNALLFTLTLLTAVGAICYLALGVIGIYNSDVVTPFTNALVLIFFALFGKFSGLYGTLRRWWKLTDPPDRLKKWLSKWKDTAIRMLERGEGS
ncbi:hypothetical protein [Halorussus lipolyticus]|uniref:hypothetical protein n=1 Tax=Halorussus lipolyticus TaxID=3034024 RepID=UPI0023E8292A|nr:hypothetical protein [Halorussus sp. DT80]